LQAFFSVCIAQEAGAPVVGAGVGEGRERVLQTPALRSQSHPIMLAQVFLSVKLLQVAAGVGLGVAAAELQVLACLLQSQPAAWPQLFLSVWVSQVTGVVLVEHEEPFQPHPALRHARELVFPAQGSETPVMQAVPVHMQPDCFRHFFWPLAVSPAQGSATPRTQAPFWNMQLGSLSHFLLLVWTLQSGVTQ